ncbi:Guanine nucleotide-binding protein-like 1 [Mycena sanguinolenta]|uniref:Guanine nucleotide-binding protein-like 1 n=1 Tax=Mycena sanguinolenta TaxID=230812 RepID=A0A8H6XFA5_9AGAR|nr:Guanine nucleotide-binding protein-like 1 [Mycena sanguinolenta]
MPPRRKPTSTTQKKAAQKAKRAIKRGDLPPPDPKKPVKRRHRGPPVSDAVQTSRKLQSAFVALPPEFLEKTRFLAATLPLTRPIPEQARIFSTTNFDDIDGSTLTCPRRPKWRFDMSKTEVERNEEGLFRKWLAETDQVVEAWQSPSKLDEGWLPQTDQASQSPPKEPEGGYESRYPFELLLSFHSPKSTSSEVAMPRSTTYFERNLEVWRQLWRVTEISQIILVLLDSRAPLLHYPPSLATYLSDRRVILVLTKVDISGPARADAWTRYFSVRYPGLKVVQVESYIEKETTILHQGRKQHDPHIPESFRRRLVEAIKEEHAAMLEPPEKVKANPAWLEKWKPRTKRDIDWERVMAAEGDKVGTVTGGPAAPHEDEEDEPKFLTIGLIGQPNVGKSSLLNALFGAHKVRASKTPGKTKHFQTLFWTPDVRLVDCPGLVMPNFVPLEMQVLSGILPISRVSAIPSCIHHAAELLPLEKVYKLSQPTPIDPVADKRTWRGERPGGNTVKGKPWTAMDVLTAYADAKGWVTAKAGRSDINRAGNAILRALAEGRVAWAFWPPDVDVDLTVDESAAGMGIWIPSTDGEGTSGGEESEEEGEEVKSAEELSENEQEEGPAKSEDEEDEDSEPESAQVALGAGRFGALQDIQGEDSDEEE